MSDFMNDFYKGIDSRIRVQCNSCKKFYHDKNNKEFIEEFGECVMCDKIRGEKLLESFSEVNEYITEEECQTDLGTQYVDIIKL